MFGLLTALLTAAADLKVKDVMRETAPDKIIYNKGFAANRMDDRPEIVSCVSAGATAFLAAAMIADKKNGTGGPVSSLADSLILGGAISNTAERIVRGKVTDYIPLGKYVYNLGDFAIYAGALLKLTTVFLRKD